MRQNGCGRNRCDKASFLAKLVYNRFIGNTCRMYGLHQDSEKALAEKWKISVDDYLQGEAVSDIKSEYINGEVCAMVGVKRADDLVVTNLTAHLQAHLRGTPCRVHSGDMKVRVQTGINDCFFIPIRR